MALIVQKYGGSSLASADYIKRVAAHVGGLKKAGDEIVVVVSAMGKTTDNLMNLAREVSSNPDKRELDMLLSVGERISISLLALALQDMGYSAISFTGSQVGIITDNRHTRARILEIRANRLREELNKGKIVIIAGFQGVSIDKEITTLGRGGSDTTAVALGAALKADRVELMKDVDGIMRADPAVIENPEIIRSITYREMEEMAGLDAGVVKRESIELAEYYGIKVGIGSSFTGKVGTIVSDHSFAPDKIKAITVEKNLLHYLITGEKISALIRELMAGKIPLKNFILRENTLSFDTPKEWKRELEEILKRGEKNSYSREDDYVLISFIGNGIKPGSKAGEHIFQMFHETGTRIKRSVIVENRVSAAIPEKESEEKIKSFYDYLYRSPVRMEKNV